MPAPDDISDHDDLGKEGGTYKLPYADEARRHALSFPPRAIGRRGRDHAQRDQLIQGAIKNRAGSHMRRLVANRDPRLYRGTKNWDERDRRDIARARAFVYLHTASLMKFAHGGQCELDSFNRLMRCPPTMLLVDLGAATRLVCRRSRVCPYCLSRVAVARYAELLDLLGDEDTVLALLSLTVPDRVWAPSLRATAEHVKDLKHRTLGWLRGVATNLFGADGGLGTFLVEPHREVRSEWAHGEVHDSLHDGLCARACQLFEVSRHRLGLLAADSTPAMPEFQAGVASIEPSLRLREHSNAEDGLRALLFGDFRGEDAPIRGAFASPPWFAATVEQWQVHFELTKWLRLFDYWGSWHSSIPSSPRTAGPRFQNASQRRGGYRSQQNLTVANAARSRDREARHSDLYLKLRPLFTSPTSRPGWQRVRQLASDFGVDLSEREARGIAGILRNQGPQ